MAALETAKIKSDLALAIEEFNMAVGISPKMADAWLNMGKAQVQHGLYKDAMESYRQYLAVAPDAPDAQAMRDELVKLEFRQERLEKTQGREGEWMDDSGSRYQLTVAGNRLTLKAEEYVPHIDAAPGPDPILDSSVPVEYQLFLQGDQLSGKWSRGELTVNTCPVPKDEADVTGEMIDSERKMVLKHERTRFTTVTT
ncbi:MAG: tetratricopeptide repeat protein, partial [Elusimicrobiales bacterium]|nr:tetratricopeptide repeat protein [Elusimicrobiales bacterium]